MSTVNEPNAVVIHRFIDEWEVWSGGDSDLSPWDDRRVKRATFNRHDDAETFARSINEKS